MRLFEIQFTEEATTSVSILNPTRRSVRKIQPLLKSQGSYHFTEYSRHQGEFLRVGVEAIGAHAIKLNGIDDVHFIRSCHDEDLWYMQPEDQEIGLNVCGQFTIEAYNASDHLITAETLIVTPSTLSLKQYEYMQAEVRDLMSAFHLKPHESDGVSKYSASQHVSVNQLADLIDRFTDALGDVSVAPTESLVRVPIKIQRENVTQWTARTILSAQSSAGQPKIKVDSVESSHDLIEHRMIRTMLDITYAYLKQLYAVEVSRMQMFQSENDARKDNAFQPNQRQSGLFLIMREKTKTVASLLSKSEERITLLEGMKQSIKFFLEEDPLFNVSSEEIKGTHLFFHEPRYKEVFECFEEILSMTPQITIEKKHFIDSLIKSPLLFEIWTLLQLYAGCIRLKFIPPGPITELMYQWYQARHQLRGFKLTLTHLQTKDAITIIYEPTLQSSEGKNRRPDYFISFKSHDDGTTHRHTLDAKYKPYGQPGFYRRLSSDLKRSCKRYFDDFKGTEYEITSATLVHSDASQDIHHWNIKNRDHAPHRYAQFNIAPGQTTHLATYIKRLIHHYGEMYGYCPSCGTVTKGIDEGYKVTYVCACQEVWVNNTCRSEFKRDHPIHLKSSRLLKYAHGNYNHQVANNWDVHCPVCDRSYNGAFYRANLLGKEVLDHSSQDCSL